MPKNITLDKRYLRVCERRIKQLSAVSCRISFYLSETLESVAAEIRITKLAQVAREETESKETYLTKIRQNCQFFVINICPR